MYPWAVARVGADEVVLYQHTSSLKVTADNCKTVWEMDVSVT